MKANELRLGNLVECCYPHDKKDFETKIEHVDFEILKDINAEYSISDIEYIPIQLTEEWMLKFGFNKEFDIFTKGNISIANCVGGFYLTQDKKHTFGKVFNNIHQLQNLYFALTGEELSEQDVSVVNAQPESTADEPGVS